MKSIQSDGSRAERVDPEVSARHFTQTIRDALSFRLTAELIDCVDDFVLVIDTAMRVIKANRAAAVFFGYSEQELAMRNVSSFFVPGERSTILKFIRRSRERRGGEAILLTRTSAKVPVHYSVSPIEDYDGRVCAYLLIGRVAGAGRALSPAYPSNGLVERLLKGFMEPVFIVDGSSRIVLDCNYAALAVFGYRREDLVGWRLLSRAATEEERERNEDLMEQADKAYAKGGIFRVRFRFPTKDGPSLLCDFAGIPFFNSDGSVAFTVALLLDRSSEEKREIELASLLERVNGLADDLAAAVRPPRHSEATSLSALGFTQRQIEIGRFVLQGASSKDIGSRLGIAESTVRNHLGVIYRKLGVSSRVLFMRAISERRIMVS